MAQVRKATLYVQPGGAGAVPRYLASADNSMVGAFSGGAATFDSVYAGNRLVGSRQTANPSRVTSQVDVRYDVAEALYDAIARPTCLPSWLVYKGCNPASKSGWSELFIHVDGAVTSPTLSGNLVDGTSGDSPDLTVRCTIDAGKLIRARPVAHKDISASVLATAFNKIIAVSPEGNCDVSCGVYSDGTSEAIAVSDGVSPATVPYIAYTRNGGQTWTTQTIAAVTNGVAQSVCIVGDWVLVACSGTTAGIYRASLALVKLGTATFTLCTGVATSNAFNDIVGIDSDTAVAVGAAGVVAVTKNSGLSFTLLTSGTSEALNAVAAGMNRNLVWAGGANGALLRISGLSVCEAITGSGASTDDITAVAVPYERPNAVVIGTDADDIFRSDNAGDPTPLWTELSFDKAVGGGTIADLKFADAMGHILWAIQTNSSSDSRLLWDPTGGAGGDFMIAIGSFASPVNNGFNSIAPTGANFAFTCGEAKADTFGFLGVVSKTS